MSSSRPFPCGLSAVLFAVLIVAVPWPTPAADTLRDDVWGVSLELPGHSAWNDHPMRDRPELIFAATAEGESCDLALSMLSSPVTLDATPDACREGFAGNPETARRQKDLELLESKAGPPAYTLYDQRIGETDRVQHQLYAYWTRGGTCLELHLSSVRCDDFRGRGLAVLSSAKVDTTSSATLETVTVGRTLGLSPDDWRVHGHVAGAYLHQAHDPRRARRFYANALRLGGGAIESRDRWTFEEGIGIAWLTEGEGEPAIEPLERALAALGPDDGGDATVESLHNLACAYALAGRVEEACARLVTALGLLDRAERKERLGKFREDEQLRAAREAPCFEQAERAAKKGR